MKRRNFLKLVAMSPFVGLVRNREIRPHLNPIPEPVPISIPTLNDVSDEEWDALFKNIEADFEIRLMGYDDSWKTLLSIPAGNVPAMTFLPAEIAKKYQYLKVEYYVVG